MYQPIEKLPELVKEFMPTNAEKFLKVCLDALDTPVSPRNEVKDDVSCAWDLSILISRVKPDFKKQTSTKILDWQLFQSKEFVRIPEPVKGCIWISPAKTDKNGAIITYGHCGTQITDERVASNNSYGINKGKFTGNFSKESWKTEFESKRGLKTYYYQLKD